jgi:hypothetical protein
MSITVHGKYADTLCKDFNLLEANVKSFEEAEVVLVTDRHTNAMHTRKFCWLANAVADPRRDMVLYEGIETTIEKLKLSFYFKPSLDSWDSPQGRTVMSQDVEKWKDITKLMAVCDLNTQSCALLKRIVQVMIEHMNPTEIRERLASIEAYDPEIEKYASERLHQFRAILAEVDRMADKVRSIWERAELITAISYVFHLMLAVRAQSFDYVEAADTGIIRNKKMMHQIDQYCGPGKRVFLQAGESHLRLQTGHEKILSQAMVGVLQRGLHGRKYVILQPNAHVQDYATFRSTRLRAVGYRVLRTGGSLIREAIVVYLLIMSVFYVLRGIPEDYGCSLMIFSWAPASFICHFGNFCKSWRADSRKLPDTGHEEISKSIHQMKLVTNKYEKYLQEADAERFSQLCQGYLAED